MRLTDKRLRSSEDGLSSQSRQMVFAEEREGDVYSNNAIDDREKQKHREYIAQFFDHHTVSISKDKKRRCFSLPGKFWAFENCLHGFRSNKKQWWSSRCVERSLQTLEYGLAFMPRRRGEPAGWSNNNYKFQEASSDAAVIAHCSAIEAMFAINKCQNAKGRLGKWNAFWWDLQGPLSNELAHMCAMLPHCLEKESDIIPFAVTFLIGRDGITTNSGDPLHIRCDLLEKQLRRSEWDIRCDSRIGYQSANGANMGLYIGTIERDV